MNGQEINLANHSQPDFHICIKGLHQISSKLFASRPNIYLFIHSLPNVLSVYSLQGMILGSEGATAGVAESLSLCPCSPMPLWGSDKCHREKSNIQTDYKSTLLDRHTQTHDKKRQLFTSSIYNCINQLICTSKNQFFPVFKEHLLPIRLEYGMLTKGQRDP